MGNVNAVGIGLEPRLPTGEGIVEGYIPVMIELRLVAQTGVVVNAWV